MLWYEFLRVADRRYIHCLGLLGPNGAGKTTLINMLVGLLSPTSGRATIGSHEITSRGKELQRIIGLCPQFDLLYDDLTVEEHLLFYVRLKGYPRKNELAHVADLMNEVRFIFIAALYYLVCR